MRTAAASSSVEFAKEKRRQQQQALVEKSLARMAREAEIREEKAAQALEQSYRVLIGYEGVFRPLCKDYMGTTHFPDPLHNANDFIRLMECLARKRVSFLHEEAHGFYKVLLTANPPNWDVGTGEGDSLPEALTFALWELLENEH